MQVKLKKEDFQAMAAHAVAHLPEEACGLVAGKKEGKDKFIEKVYCLTNIDHSNEHFSLDPKEQLAAVGIGLEEKVIGPETLLPTTGTDLSEEQRSKLEQIQGQWKETDALYGIFTSGSTGTPKAIVVSHGAASRFIRHFTEIFEITSEDVIGNQAPFDFDVSVKDIYSSIMTGAQLVLIPKEYLSLIHI